MYKTSIHEYVWCKVSGHQFMVLWALRKSTGNHWVFPMKAVVPQAEHHSPKLRGAAQWPSGSCAGALRCPDRAWWCYSSDVCWWYPPVICYIAIENGPFIDIYSGFTHWKGWFSHSYVSLLEGTPFWCLLIPTIAGWFIFGGTPMTSWTPPSVPRKAGRLAALGYQLPTEEQLRQNLVSLQAGGDGLVMSPMVLFALALVVIMVTRLY